MADKVDGLLRAIASIITRGEDEIVHFYKYAESLLDTDEERRALKLGTLAMLADVHKLRFRRMYYAFRYRRAMTKLQ